MNKSNAKVVVYLRVARDESMSVRQEQPPNAKRAERLAEEFTASISEFVEHDTPRNRAVGYMKLFASQLMRMKRKVPNE